MKVFYAGDSPTDGPARYLLGILTKLKAQVTHLPPGNSLNPSKLKLNFDLYIFSDFSYKDLTKDAEEKIINDVKAGAGFLMVGGWGSFSGPFGGWKNSKLASLLPVKCLARDDRKNFPGGALILPSKQHSILKNLSFRDPCAICGVNEVALKPQAEIVLSAHPVQYRSGRVGLHSNPSPLLVVQDNGKFRTAAFMTDFAPHWSAGFVDWGTKTKKIKIARGIEIQVGNLYVQLASQLIKWLACA